MLYWNELLCTERVKPSSKGASKNTDMRSPYKRDQGRVTFSTDFRRLAYKTQVFTAPSNAFVHNRLTHTIEVANIGESLAELIARDIFSEHSKGTQPYDWLPEDLLHQHGIAANALDNLSLYKTEQVFIKSLGEIVKTACYVHDIGNPPFGHAGENVIRQAIKEYFEENPTSVLQGHTATEDIENFEGNAFGLHILITRSEFNLTYASIGAMIKYPISTSTWLKPKGKRNHIKKNGIFNVDKETMDPILKKIGVVQNSSTYRNPLSLIMEAADDIGYGIMDLEDALRLKIALPSDIWDNRPVMDYIYKIITQKQLKMAGDKRAKRWKEYSKKKWLNFHEHEDFHTDLPHLRSLVIQSLIEDTKALYSKKYNKIIEGSHYGALLDKYSPLKKIKDFSLEKIYRHRNVLLLESSGYHVITCLLKLFLKGVEFDNKAKEEQKKMPVSAKHASILLKVESNTYATAVKEKNICNMLIAVIGFIARMSDNYVVEIYQRMFGVRIQGIE